jgi:hypothetical protein
MRQRRNADNSSLVQGKEPSARRARSIPISSNSSRAAAATRSTFVDERPTRGALGLTGISESDDVTFPPGNATNPPKKRSSGERRTMKSSGASGFRNKRTLAAGIIRGPCGEVLMRAGGEGGVGKEDHENTKDEIAKISFRFSVSGFHLSVFRVQASFLSDSVFSFAAAKPFSTLSRSRSMANGLRM